MDNFDDAKITMTGRGCRAVVENIEAFFSADPSDPDGARESTERLAAVMLMFDDILLGCGVLRETGPGWDEEREENPYYRQVVIG